MSPNFSLGRLALFAICILVLIVMGGFSSPLMGTRAWSRLITLFLVGAISVSFVDHQVGVVDPSNLRGLYIVFGILLMGAACVWMQQVKGAL